MQSLCGHGKYVSLANGSGSLENWSNKATSKVVTKAAHKTNATTFFSIHCCQEAALPAGQALFNTLSNFQLPVSNCSDLGNMIDILRPSLQGPKGQVFAEDQDDDLEFQQTFKKDKKVSRGFRFLLIYVVLGIVLFYDSRVSKVPRETTLHAFASNGRKRCVQLMMNWKSMTNY